MTEARMPNRQNRAWTWLGLLLAAALLVGCGAKHTVGDTVVYDPQANGPEGRQAPESSDNQKPAPAKKDESVGQFMEADETSVGGREWVAEIHEEDGRFWLEVPFEVPTTYAGVRASTLMQGLTLAKERFGAHRFVTEQAYWAWHPESESGLGLFMRVLTKGFGKNARYRFEVAVQDLANGGSRVEVRQHRQIIEGNERQDVGDWVPADEPDPEITRNYLSGLQKAFGE
ncbi:hypothetical protein [Thiohalorhabdus methylotrophus]|uniref:Outer membrane protein assembly factor BamC n=1 Tax=Thiohalorhabdus methylotrophus TaxID=3242694 RepID=A0ABV4TTI7_9GAMM